MNHTATTIAELDAAAAVRRSTRRPAESSRRPATPLASTTRAATWIWAVVSSINVAVWLLVSIVSGSVDEPWFLYSLVGGGVVVAGLQVANRVAGSRPARVSGY